MTATEADIRKHLEPKLSKIEMPAAIEFRDALPKTMIGKLSKKELKAEDAQRPSESRIDEAVALGSIDYFVVACPKDVTMYEDAIKTSGHQGEIELREMSELLFESLALG